MPRILIITAAFGEGHNSAARNLATALDFQSATTKVCDPCTLASPLTTRILSACYRHLTMHFPAVWGKIYYSTDKKDFSKSGKFLLRKPEQYLARLVEDFAPDVVISTYPIYPYFLARIFARTGHRIPVYVIVTDSIEINAAWLKAPADAWFVTDEKTQGIMIKQGIPNHRIDVTGFPVSPVFAHLAAVEDIAKNSPFRVLYFPLPGKTVFRRQCCAMLQGDPRVKLTIVMGRNAALLHAAGKEIQETFPGRVRLLGWTKRIPQHLCRHHLVVGKAGGATVHEAIAACCPMLIHYLVPGQEEGNLKLLKIIGGGELADCADKLTISINKLLANDCKVWREMKRALQKYHRNSGAIDAAEMILHRLSAGQV